MKNSNVSRNYIITSSDYSVAIGLAISLTLLYFLTRLQVHSELNDSANFASYIKQGELVNLFHGNHLIYLWIIYLIQQLMTHFIPQVETYTVAQAFNSLTAGIGVGVFYLLASSLIKQRWLNLGLSFIFAFSYHYWLFASDIEVFAPAILFYLLSLLVALHISAESPQWQLIMLSIFSALTIFFHLIGSLVGLIVLLILLQNNRETLYQPSLKQIQQALFYGITTAFCIIGGYALIITQILHLQTGGEIYNWIAQFQNSGFETTPSLLSALALMPVGVTRALLGLLSWLVTPELGERIVGMFAGKCLSEELYIVRNMPSLIAAILTTMGIVAGGLLAILTLLGLPGLVAAVRRFSGAVVALLAWLILYGLFIMWFEAGNPEFWGSFWLPVLILVVGLGLAQTIEQKDNLLKMIQIFVIILVIGLFGTNLGNILPQTTANNDIIRHHLSWYHSNTTANDLIILSGGYNWTGYVRYYVSGQLETLEERFSRMNYVNSWQAIQAQIELTKASGNRVFVLEDIVKPRPCFIDDPVIPNSEMYEAFYHSIAPLLNCFEYESVSICEVVR